MLERAQGMAHFCVRLLSGDKEEYEHFSPQAAHDLSICRASTGRQGNVKSSDRDGCSEARRVCAVGIARMERQRGEMCTGRLGKLLETPVILEGGIVAPAFP